MPPPRRPKKLCGSSERMSWRMPPPEEIASSTTTASCGSMPPIAASSASGWIGVRPWSARPLVGERLALGTVAAAGGVEPLAGACPRAARQALAHERRQLRQRRLRVAQDRDLGRIVLAELPGIDVEVDDRESFRHRLDVGRQRQREEIAADREQHVVLGQNGADRRREPRHGAAEQRMRERKGRGAGDALRDTRARRGARRARRARRCARLCATASPAMMSGRSAAARSVAAASSAARSPRIRGATRVGAPRSISPSAFSTSTGSDRNTGPVGGASAVFAARWTMRGRSSRRCTSADHFTQRARERRQVGPEDRLGDVEALVVLAGGDENGRGAFCAS